MAKQVGVFPIEGTLDNITFLKTKDGYIVKKKTVISAERIASDPAFARTRENNAEFGRAGKEGKLLRSSIAPLLKGVADHRMVSRLHKSMIAVQQADTINVRGARTVTDGDLSLVTGFDFNVNGKLSTIFSAPYTTNTNRATGVLDVNVPAFTPSQLITAPTGATHFKLVMGGAGLDFAGKTYVNGVDESTVLPLGNTATAPIALTVSVTAGSSLSLFIVLGIKFYQEVNGLQYALNDGSGDAVSVVAVAAYWANGPMR